MLQFIRINFIWRTYILYIIYLLVSIVRHNINIWHKIC
jgi:hypothetical protein